MTFQFLRGGLSLSFLFLCLSASAQQRPIGNWRAHLPYNAAQGIATDGLTLYTISEKGFFTYNSANGNLERFSKVEGMHETGTTAIGFDRTTNTCIIAYRNSNIDLFRNHNFKVLPDLKNKSFSGNKSINHIFTTSGIAYLSTSLGILVIDLNNQEVKETYVFSTGGQTIGINAFEADATHFYAATTRGLYRILRSHPTPQVFSNWQPLDTQRGYKQLAGVGGNAVYTTSTSDTVFRITSGGLLPVFAGDTIHTIMHLSGGAQILYVGRFGIRSGSGKICHLSLSNELVDSTRVGYPKGVVETDDARSWVADLYQGMGVREVNEGIAFVSPSGPNSADNTGLWANNGEVWAAHGGITGNYQPRSLRSGLSRFRNEGWQAFQPYNYPLFLDSVFDFLDVLKDPRDGTLYAGTFNSGLFELKANGSARIIKQGELGLNASDFSATSLAIDLTGNLWVTKTFTTNELSVRTVGGTWYHYQLPSFGRQFRLAYGLLIDDFNQKWFYSAVGGGVIVYNDAGTPENIADDPNPAFLAFGKGQGNLPSSNVRSLAKDRDGAIWIGTDNGIGIVNCPGGVIDGTCEAEQRVVQFDQFAGLLFSGESVRAIAVDGGNRKWIGTTNGVWLLSPDAGKILLRFTVDNSPLPSNNIQKIAIDGVTGDVYIGTDEGLVSYRATATDGGSANTTIKTFPNPVPSGYTGPIAIQGIVTDGDVRITDIAGQLVYRTKATGGQAVWNGLDYTGTRPQSGVYLIFITNKDGSQTSVGKMMLMH